MIYEMPQKKKNGNLLSYSVDSISKRINNTFSLL